MKWTAAEEMENEILVSSLMGENIIKMLEKLEFKINLTKANENILESLNTHPDMLLHVLPDGSIVVDRDNVSYYRSLWPDKNVVESEKKLTGKYPGDIALNGAVFKNYFIHNLKYTDRKILDYYEKNGYTLIDVKQGYTKCNLVCGNNCLITSDTDIYRKMKDRADILLIDHKQIILKGFDYGFIGGASGLLNNRLYFTGNLENHSSYNKIMDFLSICGEEVGFLSTDEIEDFGSILIIP